MDDKKFDLTFEQYFVYLDLLRQTTFQRSISNYFFIIINVAIILIGYLSTPIIVETFYVFSLISIVGFILCIYWIQESRELYILNEARYRTIIELETQLKQFNFLNKEWEYLGNYKFRRSPVFFVKLSRIFSLIFLLIHFIMYMIFDITLFY